MFGNPLLAPMVVEDPPPPSDEGLGLRRSQRERRPPDRYGTVAYRILVVYWSCIKSAERNLK